MRKGERDILLFEQMAKLGWAIVTFYFISKTLKRRKEDEMEM